MDKSFLVISIVGPTAVGKTELAFEVAEYMVENSLCSGVDIISADSRQVYKGLELITGADIPPEFISKNTWYEKGQVKVWGLAFLQPNQDWSVAHFQELALTIIEQAQAQNRLVIMVGGTGLYHDQVFNPDATLHIPPQIELRNRLALLSLQELQAEVEKQAPAYWANANHSDRSNPRRLMRALEIAEVKSNGLEPENTRSPFTTQFSHQTFGLTDDLEKIQSRIQDRVRARLDGGAVAEVERLIANFTDWNMPAFSATGVKEVRMMIEGMIDRDQCIELWARREFQYAKRQLTWWRKREDVVWLEANLSQEQKWQAVRDTLFTRT